MRTNFNGIFERGKDQFGAGLSSILRRNQREIKPSTEIPRTE